MRIVGFDPGQAETGWGVITDSPLRYVKHGVIKTKSDREQSKRLSEIAEQTAAILKEHEPGVVAIEDVSFLGTKYASSGDTNRVIGVIMLVAHRYNVPVALYTPLEWKKITLNYANADKRRVQETVQSLLGLEKPLRPQHSSDATAVAIAYARSPK